MEEKKEIVEKLKQDILLWQGFKAKSSGKADAVGLGRIECAFPNGIFPKGTIHEFIALKQEHSASCDGFIGGLLAVLMKNGAPCVWVSTSRKLFPVSLSHFNVKPERIFFVDVNTEKELLWIVEEALKCKGLCAVVAEVDNLDLSASRRLQLACEKSGVTGLFVRKNPQKKTSTIATARWLISPAPSDNEDDLPGIGFPRWNIELLKIRNGSPGKWTLEWMADEFIEVVPEKKQREKDYQEQKQVG